MKYSFLLLLAVFLLLGCPPEETKYHVYYHGNDYTTGSPPTDSKEYCSGDTVQILGKGDLKNSDYDFRGWQYYDQYYYPGDYIKIKEGEYLTIHYEDINLYARWDDDERNTPFTYKIENGEVTITHYSVQSEKSVKITDTLQSKPVTVIGDNAFSNLSITSIERWPKNLKKIGFRAFASNNITDLIIPDTVESIGLGAFRNNSLTRITFGTRISSIEPYTFGNNQLTAVTIPGNIVSIGTEAFYENDINTITIGGGVDIKSDTSLGTNGASFREYYNLEKKQAGHYLYAGNGTWKRY